MASEAFSRLRGAIGAVLLLDIFVVHLAQFVVQSVNDARFRFFDFRAQNAEELFYTGRSIVARP